MKCLVKYMSLILLLTVLMFSFNGTLQAQGDAFFNKSAEDRTADVVGYKSAADDYIFSYSLFEENGFTFNGFENGNDDDGFTFGDFDFSPDNAPLGSGLMLLSCAGMFYVGTKRNRNKKENK